MYILSYCPYQKQYHIEDEKEFWERTENVYERVKFKGCAYTPIKQFETYGDYTIWFKENVTV